MKLPFEEMGKMCARPWPPARHAHEIPRARREGLSRAPIDSRVHRLHPHDRPCAIARGNALQPSPSRGWQERTSGDRSCATAGQRCAPGGRPMAQTRVYVGAGRGRVRRPRSGQPGALGATRRRRGGRPEHGRKARDNARLGHTGHVRREDGDPRQIGEPDRIALVGVDVVDQRRPRGQRIAVELEAAAEGSEFRRRRMAGLAGQACLSRERWNSVLIGI